MLLDILSVQWELKTENSRGPCRNRIYRKSALNYDDLTVSIQAAYYH